MNNPSKGKKLEDFHGVSLYKEIKSLGNLDLRYMVTLSPSHSIICHVDLDCFFAAVLLLDHPEWKGLPLIVGADPKEGAGRGVVSTASYEARKFGIRSGMPISQAYRRCPHGIYQRGNFERIHAISNQVMTILRGKSPVFEQGGSDEAYLDFTSIASTFEEAHEKAIQIQNEIDETVGISCSIGIAFSKTLAKIASDYDKPHGITIITPENYIAILSPLSIGSIPGIGKKTRPYYESRGFKLLGDIFKHDRAEIVRILGNSGDWIWRAVNGEDGRRVHAETEQYLQKSASLERTFSEDIDDIAYIRQKLGELNEKLHQSLKQSSYLYRTVNIKIRFQGFITYTRSSSFSRPNFDPARSLEKINTLLEEFIPSIKAGKKVRLIGVRFSNISPWIRDPRKNLLRFLSTTTILS